MFVLVTITQMYGFIICIIRKLILSHINNLLICREAQVVDLDCVLCNQLPVSRWADMVPALHFQDFECICAERWVCFFFFVFFISFSDSLRRVFNLIEDIFIF